MEQIGDGQDPGSPPPRGPGRDIGGEGPEAGLRPGQAADARERDAKSRALSRADHDREEVHFVHPEPSVREEPLDRGEQAP